MLLLCNHHLLSQELVNRNDAAIAADIGSSDVLENHGYQNWKGQGMTEMNDTTDVSNGFGPNSTPKQ